MRFKTALLASCFWTLAALPAAAEPISAAVIGISTFLSSGGIVAGIVKIGLVFSANYGMGLIQKAQAARQARKNQRPSGVTLSVQVGDTQPRSYLIGTRATAGRRVYIGTWGEIEKTPNAYLTDVVELSCLPNRAGAQGLERTWVGDKEATILWAEPHPDGRGYPVQQYRVSGVDYLWIKFLDGTQTVADPFLVATFGGLAVRPFKSTMIGRGCQAVILTARINQDLFKGGQPQGLYQPKPMPLYDLREDATNGGIGPHRWADQSTWEPSDNLAQMIYTIARGIYYDGRWLHGGRNFAQHRLPASSWIASLNEADRLVGGRRQFCGGLEIAVDQDPLEVIEDLRLGCAGKLAEVGGILKMRVGAPAAAVYSFADAQLIVTSDQDFEPFPTVSATHNTITAVYPEPAARWTNKDAPERSSAALLARDGGERLPVSFEFEAVSNVDQVQCLMSTMIEEEQRWRIHEFVLPPDASALEPLDVVSFSSNRNSYSNKKFEIDRATTLASLCQLVRVKELDPSDYDPPEILLPPIVGPTGPIGVPAQPMYGWYADKATIFDGDGNPRRPSIKVGCAPDQDDVRAVWIQVRLASTGQIVFDSQATAYAPPFEWILPPVFLPLTTYEVAGELIPYRNRATEWSAWISITTSNIKLMPGRDFDPYDGVIGFDELGDDVREFQNWVGSGVRDLQEKLEEIGLLVADQDLGNALARRNIRTQLTAEIGDFKAGYIEQIEVIATEYEALALSVETLQAELSDPVSGLVAVATAVSGLQTQVSIIDGDIEAMVELISGIEAQVGDIDSSVNLRGTAVAGGGDGYARYAIQVKMTDGDWSSQAGLYLEVKSGSPSRILLDAQQLFFGDLSSSASPLNPFVFSDGHWRSEVQDIGLVNAGTISFGAGKVIIDQNGIVVTS